MFASIRNRSCITGVGDTIFSKKTERSTLSLTLEASIKAINDAGLHPDQIDGLIPYGASDVCAEDLITNFNMTNITFSVQTPMGGASCVSALQSAALAVTSGIASHVLITLGRGKASGNIANRMLSMPQMKVVNQFERPLGFNAPAQFYAPMATRHMALYGTRSEQFAKIAVTSRENALLNDNAIMKTPITIEDHQKSRVISSPFRLLDCSLESAGAGALIVSSLKESEKCRKEPIYISGFAEGHPDSPSSITQRAELTTLGLAKAAPKAFEMAKLSIEDIDIIQIYDCFTYIVLCQLEDLGFCKKGEGGNFIDRTSFGITGDLPLNTHGGLLSEAHIAGMNHIIELVRQLRNECGIRQVKNAKIGLVTGFGDLGDGSLAILQK